MRLGVYTASPEIKDLENKMAKLDEEKETAIKEEAYERAGEIKKEQNSIREQLICLNNQWERDKKIFS